jgi:hypothetical protein
MRVAKPRVDALLRVRLGFLGDTGGDASYPLPSPPRAIFFWCNRFELAAQPNLISL